MTAARRRRRLRFGYTVERDIETGAVLSLVVFDNHLMGKVTFRRGARSILRKLERITQTSGLPEIDHYIRGLIDGGRYG